MSSAADAYLNTRVSVMATRLFKDGWIDDRAAPRLDELAERFGLDALLDEQLSTRAKSRAIEQSLFAALFFDLAILTRPMHAGERALVLAWTRRFALFNLKTLIRGKLYNLDPNEIRANLYDLPAGLRLSHQELFRADNVLELLRILERGPFSLIARQAREVYERKREPFALEAAIDQRYYGELMRLILQFQGEPVRPLRQLIGATLDRANLLWLLRFRFTYRLSPSETFYQLVPSPHLLHRDRLLQLVNLDSFAQVLEALPAPLDALMAEAPDILGVQRRAGRYLAGVARRILRHSPSGVARALAYLMLREKDLALLFGLIQGQLLGWPADLIQAASDRDTADLPQGPLAAAA